MRFIKLFVIILTFTNLTFGQQKGGFQGRISGEYIPQMFSNWKNATLGGQVSYKHFLDEKQCFIIIADGRFIPTSSKQLNFNYQKQLGIGYSYYILQKLNTSLNIYGGVNYSLASKNEKEQAFYPTFLQFNYALGITENTRILTSFINIYEIRNSNFTNSLRIGLEVYKSFYVSIDLLQFINWGNNAIQMQNNIFSPYFY